MYIFTFRLLLFTTTLASALRLQLLEYDQQIRLPAIFNENIGQFFSFSFEHPSYCYAEPTGKTKWKSLANVVSQTDSVLEIPHIAYSKVSQEGEVQVIVEGQTIGKAFKASFTGEIANHSNITLPMMAIVSPTTNKPITTDGNINLYDLLTFFSNSTSQYKQIVLYSLKQLELIVQPQRIVDQSILWFGNHKDKMVFTGITLQSGQVLADTLQATLGQPSLNSIALPATVMINMLQALMANYTCWLSSTKSLQCLWSNSFPAVSFHLADHKLNFTQNQYIQICYLNLSKKAVVCKMRFSQSKNDVVKLGGLFYSKYNVHANQDGSIFINASATIQPPRQRKSESILQNNFRIKQFHTWMVTAFTFLLLGLKGYHMYFKTLPRASYKSFDSVVFDNQSNTSLPSSNSAGDQSEKDRFNDFDK